MGENAGTLGWALLKKWVVEKTVLCDFLTNIFTFNISVLSRKLPKKAKRVSLVKKEKNNRYVDRLR